MKFDDGCVIIFHRDKAEKKQGEKGSVVMFNLGMPELVLILVIALVVFGPGKLPEAGKSLGKGISELRRALSGESAKDEPITIKAEPVDKKPEEHK